MMYKNTKKYMKTHPINLHNPLILCIFALQIGSRNATQRNATRINSVQNKNFTYTFSCKKQEKVYFFFVIGNSNNFGKV